jgi:O-antigen/teichoic acid export membrane protein
MLRSNGADWPATGMLCAVILAGSVPVLKSSVLRTATELHGEYRRIQKLEFGNAVLRVVAIGILALTRINALLATSVAVVTNWITLLFLGRWAGQHADLDASMNADDRREIWRLSLRLLPNTLFFCFQGQITLLILTVVGNPNGIADVTALGRLSALLMVFSVTFGSVLVPRFARCQDPDRLPRLYVGLVAATTLGVVPVLLAGWFTPGPLLWLLGAKYVGLENECGWAVSTACISQVATAMVQLNGAKSWVRIGTVVYAPLTIAVQILVLIWVDVSHLHGVLVFSFLTSLTALPTTIADAYFGLLRSRASVP